MFSDIWDSLLYLSGVFCFAEKKKSKSKNKNNRWPLDNDVNENGGRSPTEAYSNPSAYGSAYGTVHVMDQRERSNSNQSSVKAFANTVAEDSIAADERDGKAIQDSKM